MGSGRKRRKGEFGRRQDEHEGRRVRGAPFLPRGPGALSDDSLLQTPPDPAQVNSHRTTDVKSCARRLPASVPDPMAQRTPKDSRALAAAAAAPQVCGLQVDVPRRRLAGSASAGPALRMPLARSAARRVRPRVRLAESAATAPIDSPRPGVTPPRTWTPPPPPAGRLRLAPGTIAQRGLRTFRR